MSLYESSSQNSFCSVIVGRMHIFEPSSLQAWTLHCSKVKDRKQAGMLVRAVVELAGSLGDGGLPLLCSDGTVDSIKLCKHSTVQCHNMS